MDIKRVTLISNPKSRKKYLFAYALSLYLIKLFLTSSLPFFAATIYSYDDNIMFRLANCLIHRNWLGAYNQLTLAKGMMFPVYLAAIHSFNIPLLLANNLLYLVACLAFIAAISNIIKSKLWIAIIYAVMLFDPISYAVNTFERSYRDDIYYSLVLLLFSGVIAIYLNRRSKLKKLVLLGIGTGLVLAMGWFTREDDMWVFPFVFGALFITLLLVAFDKSISSLKEKLKRLLAFLLTPIVFCCMLLLVSAVNYEHYGVFITNDYTAGSFQDAYKALVLVKPVDWQPTMPVTYATREKIYAVSPAFNELKPYLENHPFRLKSRQFPGSVFSWALRDAVYEAGYKTAAEEQAYYSRLAREVSAACEDGKLPARSGYIFAFVAPWDNRYIPSLMHYSEDAIKIVTQYQGVDVSPGQSLGKTADIREYEWIANEAAIYPNDIMVNYTSRSKISALQMLLKLYQRINPAIIIAGLLCFLIITVRLLTGLILKRHSSFDLWIIAAGLFLSFFVRILLIGYTSASSFIATNYWYLAPDFCIMQAFNWLCISYAASRGFRFLSAKLHLREPLSKASETAENI